MFNLMMKIAQSNELELDTILKAIMARYETLFPNQEICVFSLEKGSNQNEQLDRMIQMLNNQKTN